MRSFSAVVLAACVSFVAAQNNTGNAINVPNGGLAISAGQSTTITWANPVGNTVTIKLQQGSNVSPSDGTVLASSIPNSGSATFTIPSDVANQQYSIEIIDDSNPSNYNFSPQFGVSGASGTASSATASSTGSASSSASASSASASSASASSASASSASASSASSSASGSSSSSAASSTSSSSPSSTSSASASAQSTTAPTGAAVPLKVQGGLLAMMVGAAVVL